MLAISRIAAVASAKPLREPISPGWSAATVAVAALPITALNQAGSSRTGGRRAGPGGRPSCAISCQLSRALRASVGRENGVPGTRWEACRGEFSCQYGIVTVVSIGHGKDVSSEVLAPVVSRRGQRLREITQRARRGAVALSVGIRRDHQRHALRIDAGTVARPCCVGLRTDTSRPGPVV